MTAIRRKLIRITPEWVVAAALLLVALVFQRIAHIPLEWSFFSPILSGMFSFAGTYLLVAFLVALWINVPALLNRKENQSGIAQGAARQLRDALCFGFIVSLSFYIKLLIPLFRSVSYDPVYEVIDRACFSWLNPIIAWRSHWMQIGWINDLYDVLFFGMFFVSFIAHNLRGRSGFRRVFLASLLVQGAGAVLYAVAPAVGPFLYHQSANLSAGAIQHNLYSVRQHELAGGVNWMRLHADRYLTYGLAAMPSLHAAASFVFLYYAWKYMRPLALIYGPVLAWIMFEAMATRWHYGIDLAAGLALACGSIALANLWMSAHEAGV